MIIGQGCGQGVRETDTEIRFIYFKDSLTTFGMFGILCQHFPLQTTLILTV